MANQERGAGQGIFPITPTRERTPVLPRPKTEPTPVSPEPPKKSLHERLARVLKNRLVRIGLATGVIGLGGGLGGLGIYEAYQHDVTPIHRGVDVLSNNTLIDKNFPIKLEQSSFTPVSQEEEQELWKNTKTVDLKNHTFTIGFPVDQAIIDKSPNLRMNSYFEPKLLLGVSNIAELESAGIKNINQISGFPKDTPIYFRYDQSKFSASVIKIGIAGETQTGSVPYTPAYTTFRIFLRDMQTGDNFDIIVSGLYASPLIEVNPYPTDHSAVFEDGTLITPDTPIFQLTTDLQDWDGTNQVLPGQGGQITLSNVGGVKANPNPSGVPTLTPVFLKTPARNIASQQ